MVFSVGIALLINEIQNTIGKKFVQTVIYLPHFLSWVVVAAIFTLIFASDGLVNSFVGGTENWLTNKNWWRPIWYFINRWKETGWGTIIFLAAVTGISPDLYEAAEIDGAGRLKQTWYITIPSLMNTILVVFILNLAKIMNVFESVFVLYNDLVYSVSDVIQTYTYRAMKDRMDYGYSTAVGLFKSVVSLILVLGANYVSGRIRGRGII
jgi:putative aldouronate transport system permease protein